MHVYVCLSKEVADIPPSEVGNNLCSTKHWHSFEGSLGETAERWGADGVCMALSEHNNTILS